MRQTAYQILVGESRGELEDGRGGLWDSGKVESDQNLYVPYGGKPLGSNQRCFWKVRIWDERGEASAWSETAGWITGLLNPLSEWHAEWIGLDDAAEGLPTAERPFGLGAAQWIIGPGSPGEMPGTGAMPPSDFMKEITIGRDAARVTIALHADPPAPTSCSQLFVNGRELLQFGYGYPTQFGDGFPRLLEITGWLREGTNTIAVRRAPRLLAAIRIEDRGGSVTLIRSDESWKACAGETDLWDEAATRRAPWTSARALATRTKAAVEAAPQGVMPPAVRLRGEFKLKGPVRLAVLHATALGLYDVYLNGRRVGEGRFKPGWTQYNRRIVLVSDDVTSLVRAGVNAMGAELAEGWFAGHVAWYGRDPNSRPRFAAQLHVEYADGTQETIATGPGWKACHGPTRQADLLMGETYDARREQEGWTLPGYDARAWAAPATGSTVADNGLPKFVDVTRRLADEVKRGDNLTIRIDNSLGGDPAPGYTKQLRVDYTVGGEARSVVIREGDIFAVPMRGDPVDSRPRIQRALYGRFTPVRIAPCTFAARACPPVEVRREVRPVKISEPHKGVYVFDFGEEVTGWTRLQLSGAGSEGTSGGQVLIRYAEALRPDGTIDTTNLRSISPGDTYIPKDGANETWEPRFTFHGFRYAQVLGLGEPPTTATLTAIAAGSAGPLTSTFRCSSEGVNRLYEAIARTQLDNTFEVPMNGPARDERTGAARDIAHFLGTAVYNQRGLDTFAWKYLLDLLDHQVDDGTAQRGNVGAIAPAPHHLGTAGPATLDHGVVTVLIPWTLYQFHGDLERARRAWPALKRYMSFVEQIIRDLNDQWVDDGGLFGDMLPPGPATPAPVIARAVATLASDSMAELAEALGQQADAQHWRDFSQHLRASFERLHVKEDGTVEGDTQTAYALALRMGMVGPKLRARVAERFAARLERDGGLPRTGYAGVAHLLPALTAAGRADLAAEVIQARGAASWGAMLDAGAKTMWETWQAGAGDALCRTPLGACGEWLFADLLGFQPAEPGFKRVRVRPAIGCGLTFAEGSFLSVRGRIGAAWRVEGGRRELRVSVPPNTTAEVWLPAREGAKIREGGRPAEQAEHVKKVGVKEGCVVYETGSGEYRFEW